MNDPNRPVTGYPAAGAPPPNPNGYGGASHQQPPIGTAYPYAAPPPGSAVYYQNNPYYQPNHYDTQRNTLFRRVIGMAIACMVIAGTFVFILWLIFRPRIPEFRVDSLSVSNLNLTNSLISGKWDLRFTVRNPNKKMTLYYDDVAAAVFYDDVSLSDTTVPPFFQEKRAETARQASFATAGAYVNNRAFDQMNKERSQKGAIGFNVRIVARVRFRSGAWRARRRFIRVYCKDLSVGVGSNNSSGTLLGGARQCRVGL